jgi:hypothetical protein
MDMPKIQNCEVPECSYNRDSQCHAIAITVGDNSMAHCDTFLKLGRKGGIEGLTGGVGACKMVDCKFNRDLECSADPGIVVSHQSGRAQCISFSPM